MTTQELKEYINKILGNNIRCILPSYWWKKLFSNVVDKIDEIKTDLEQNILQVADQFLYITDDPTSTQAKKNSDVLGTFGFNWGTIKNKTFQLVYDDYTSHISITLRLHIYYDGEIKYAWKADNVFINDGFYDIEFRYDEINASWYTKKFWASYNKKTEWMAQLENASNGFLYAGIYKDMSCTLPYTVPTYMNSPVLKKIIKVYKANSGYCVLRSINFTKRNLISDVQLNTSDSNPIIPKGCIYTVINVTPDTRYYINTKLGNEYKITIVELDSEETVIKENEFKAGTISSINFTTDPSTSIVVLYLSEEYGSVFNLDICFSKSSKFRPINLVSQLSFNGITLNRFGDVYDELGEYYYIKRLEIRSYQEGDTTIAGEMSTDGVNTVYVLENPEITLFDSNVFGNDFIDISGYDSITALDSSGNEQQLTLCLAGGYFADHESDIENVGQFLSGESPLRENVSLMNAKLFTKQDILHSGANIKTINGQSILGSGDMIIEGGGNIELDNVMSSTSKNAVQNKVIKAYVDNAITNVTVTSDAELSSTSTNPVQNKVIKVALDDKVDKVEGKQLSTEDFTTELKEKLNELSEIGQSDEIYVGSEMPTDDNIVVWIDPDASIGDVDWDGITIDEEFSPTSTNPVQNKTVYTLLERLDGIEAILDNINGE